MKIQNKAHKTDVVLHLAIPLLPPLFGHTPKANMKISVPVAPRHEGSDNETQINSPPR